MCPLDHPKRHYRKWGAEAKAIADAERSHAVHANAPPPAIAAVVAPPPANAVVVEQDPPPANAVVVEQVPEARQDSDSDIGYSPLPVGQEVPLGGQEVSQEATSNVFAALGAGEDLLYSPSPSDARSDKEEGEMEEEESGAQGYWNSGSR